MIKTLIIFTLVFTVGFLLWENYWDNYHIETLYLPTSLEKCDRLLESGFWDDPDYHYSLCVDIVEGLG